jgi:hypothetical protein
MQYGRDVKDWEEARMEQAALPALVFGEFVFGAAVRRGTHRFRRSRILWL